MSSYYVVTRGYSAAVKGPFDEALARKEAESVARHGHDALLVQHIDTCAPKPREIEWKGDVA